MVTAKLAVTLQKLAVGVELTALAQVADQIPVHAGVVLATRLLVEEYVPGRPADAVVGADAELPEVPRPLVRVEHRVEVLLTLLGARLDYPPFLEPEPHARHLAPGHGRRDAEVDAAVGRVRDGAGEVLPAGHVVPPIAVQELAPLDGEREVRLRSHYPHLPRLLQPLD